MSTIIRQWVMASVIASCGTAAWAQESSLYRRDYTATEDRHPLTLANTSFIYQPHQSPLELKLHSHVTIVVNEKSVVTSKGDVDTKRKGNLTAAITDWVKFKGLSVHPDPMPEGDPKVNGAIDTEFRANAELKTQDALQFRISAEIVDVRPNGAFVIEAHSRVQINDEILERSLTGIVQREDVLPNLEVKSDRIAELQIFKKESGHVRDGYRRGWLTRIWDVVSPF